MRHFLFKCITFLGLFFYCFNSFSQITFHDGVVQYDIITNGEKAGDLLKNATFNVYIRGTQSKTELTTPFGKTITYFEEKTGQVIQLNEYGNQRLMVKMNETEYRELSRRYDSVRIEMMPDKKNIAGFNCLRSNIVFKDGQSMMVYFSKDLIFQSSFNGISVKLPGFPLEYESEMGGVKVIYSAKQVSTRSVPASQFDINTDDYKEINYNELRKN
jgi:hypothetical protein